jgi:hypothetical protein
MTAWRAVGDGPLAPLAAARGQAHHAVQWLARAARAYVPPQPDDSHTNLGWDEPLDGLATHPLKGELRLGLRLPDLALVLREGAAQADSLPLDGRTDAQARQWLGDRLSARGLDAGALDAPSPYDIPADPVASGAPYRAGAQAGGLAAGLAALAAWFGNAERALGAVRRQMDARKLVASPLRCWPHHFDLATLTLLDAGDAERARSVNAGFSPGDNYYDEPYFYVSPYPYPDAAALPPLPAPGHWHTHDFTAAVAPASRIRAADDPQRDVDAFLRDAVAACVNVLR